MGRVSANDVDRAADRQAERRSADQIERQVCTDVHPPERDQPGQRREREPPARRGVGPRDDRESGGHCGMTGREALIAFLSAS